MSPGAAARRDCGRGLYFGPRKAAIRLSASAQAVMDYEDFAYALDFLTADELCPLIVAGDEVVDNLVTHGEVGDAGILVVVRKRAPRVTLSFFVESHKAFADFASRHVTAEPRPPRFDAEERRWHGLGLTMCMNLATRITYRSGERIDRVFLEFEPKC